MDPRKQYAQAALETIPRILQLLNRNPLSASYGCFDREYWHYKTRDFPCGMSQEMLLPLAQAVTMPLPGSPYFGNARLRELVRAAMDFTMRISHRNSATDDYYPHEQALGATVSTTHAIAHACLLLSFTDARTVDFLIKRGDYLATHEESGRLANHQAMAALAAYLVFTLTGRERFRTLARRKAELVLSWQHPDEGWFAEYEGADPGYQTATISFLARLRRASGWQWLDAPLAAAVDFAWLFLHPDHSFGGEYGSRDTYHFFPHGFELLAGANPKAKELADGLLRGMASGSAARNDDDRMAGQLSPEYFFAHQDFFPRRMNPPAPRAPFLSHLPDAGLVVVSTPSYYAVANLKKGGVLKAYTPRGCFCSDTGLGVMCHDGLVLTSQVRDPLATVTVGAEGRSFTVEGRLHRRPDHHFSPGSMALFRAASQSIARVAPNLLRRLVQRAAMVGIPSSEFPFQRHIEFLSDRLVVTDTLPQAVPACLLGIGPDATSMYTANSQVYQRDAVLLPWQWADDKALAAARAGGFTWRREITPGG